MENLQNLLRLAGETPIMGLDLRFLAIAFVTLGPLLSLYFVCSSLEYGKRKSKARKLSIRIRNKPYPNWKEMKILSVLFIVLVALVFFVWIILANLPSFSQETMQRYTAGGREPLLFPVRLLMSGSIFLALSFIGILGIIFADWDRGKPNAKLPLLGVSPKQQQNDPEKKKTDSD